ncbi:MAG: hypothetical protein L0K86_13505 [Actinomycetia bacterium]|nr:hypothetical protein [Actinomycetes bacterium]
MPNVLIRGISDADHRVLAEQARERGQSLQQYLAGELARLATMPTMEQVLGRIERHDGGRIGVDVAVEHLAGERERR